jgi:putative ABC transport system ATP-binding protein
VNNPSLILADEPTGNLDSEMAEAVLGLLNEINAAGTTIVMVTHDPDLARRVPRNVHVLDGRLQAPAQPEAPPIGAPNGLGAAAMSL